MTRLYDEAQYYIGGMGAIIRDVNPDFALTKPTLKSYPLNVVEEVVGVLVEQSIAMRAWLLFKPS